MIDQKRFGEIEKAVSKNEAEVSVYRKVIGISLTNAGNCINNGNIKEFGAWIAIEEFCKEKLSENLKLLEDLSKELKDSD